MNRIAILGSTGSVGEQALQVVRANPHTFKVNLLTAGKNADRLIAQALEFKPQAVVIADETKYVQVKEALSDHPINVAAGDAAVAESVGHEDIDLVLTAIVGFCGLKPTINAINAGKTIALANKETLVVAGDLVMRLARERGVDIIPVDSEHSAIFQCLQGEEANAIEKVILTASGGPFRGKNRSELENITKLQALKHPNWNMGAKITIDSATLMNKGLEVIEAKWLFNLSLNQIEVVVHPQSIVHSLVQFNDGSLKAQMGLPDMKLPIQYALAYPKRMSNDFKRFSFRDYGTLTFEEPDINTFRSLTLAFEALNAGGNMPCTINAANEVVVQAFLEDRIGFLQMSDIIEKCMEKIPYVAKPTYDDYILTDGETRQFAVTLL